MIKRAPQTMHHEEKMRIRAAAFRAPQVYPGPVGEFLSRDLMSWEEFGYRLSRDGLIRDLVDHLLDTPPSPIVKRRDYV